MGIFSTPPEENELHIELLEKRVEALENADLSNTIDERDKEIGKLRFELHNKDKRNFDLNREVLGLKAQIDRLVEMRDKFEDQMIRERSENNELRREIKSLNKMEQELRAMIRGSKTFPLKKQMDLVEKENMELRERVEELKKRNKKLELEIEKVKADEYYRVFKVPRC